MRLWDIATFQTALFGLASAGVLIAAPPVAGAGETDWRRSLGECCEISAADIAALDRGETIGRVLKAREDGDIGVLGAVKVNRSKEFYLAWYRGIQGLRQSSLIEDVGVFHTPAQPADVAGVRFDSSELRKLQNCKPGNCAVKLNNFELAALHKGVNWFAPDVSGSATGVLRGLITDYVAAYQRSGNAALGAYQDKDRVVDIWGVIRSLAANFTGLRALYPDLFNRIEGDGRPRQGADDFIYWSRENYGFGFKSTLNVSHVMVQRGAAAYVIASKQIRASHYYDGSLGFTILADAPGGGSYLFYVNRSRFDLLRGGGWKRSFAASRMPGAARKEMDQLRRTLAASGQFQ